MKLPLTYPEGFNKAPPKIPYEIFLVASALAVVMPIALAMVQPVAQVAFSGAAIEIPTTPLVLVIVPTAVTLPPVVVPAATPSPPVIRMPLAPEFVTPARLTLPTASTTIPPRVPESCIRAPMVMLPPIPRPVK